MRRETTAILEKNEGMHNQKAYRRGKAMLEGHGYTHPRLYHLVLMVGDFEGSADGLIERFLKAVRMIALKLRSKNCASRWRGAVELDDEKGLHLHVFILVNNAFSPVAALLNTEVNGWLRTSLTRHGLRFYIAPPQNKMHLTENGKQQLYAAPTKGDKLTDCLEWLSYIYKARSKPDDIRTIYHSSRDSKHKPPERIWPKKPKKLFGKGIRKPCKPTPATSP